MGDEHVFNRVKLLVLLVIFSLCSDSHYRCAAIPSKVALVRPIQTLDRRSQKKVSVKKSIAAIVTAKKVKGGVQLVDSSLQLDYLETMTAGAVSRTFAQLCMHPINTFKTILQMKVGLTTHLR